MAVVVAFVALATLLVDDVKLVELEDVVLAFTDMLEDNVVLVLVEEFV